MQPHPQQPADAGYFHMDWRVYNQLPWFHWRDVYTLTGAPMEVKKTRAQVQADKAKAWAAGQSSSSSSR